MHRLARLRRSGGLSRGKTGLFRLARLRGGLRGRYRRLFGLARLHCWLRGRNCRLGAGVGRGVYGSGRQIIFGGWRKTHDFSFQNQSILQKNHITSKPTRSRVLTNTAGKFLPEIYLEMLPCPSPVVSEIFRETVMQAA